ncbi:hypothetical protein D3C76_1275490 [compost metagenome]
MPRKPQTLRQLYSIEQAHFHLVHANSGCTARGDVAQGNALDTVQATQATRQVDQRIFRAHRSACLVGLLHQHQYLQLAEHQDDAV